MNILTYYNNLFKFSNNNTDNDTEFDIPIWLCNIELNEIEIDSKEIETIGYDN